MLDKIVTGGQTGVDRAALDVAIGWQLDHGGWIPNGRLAEDGIISSYYYNLKEMPGKEYKDRTEQNVIDSDGTLIIYSDTLSCGTALTFEKAREHGRPHLCIDMSAIHVNDAAHTLAGWISCTGVQILNVAGPRASEDCKGYGYTYAMLNSFLTSQNSMHACDNVAIHSAAESMSRIRHWDTIRWSAPALLVATLAFLSSSAQFFSEHLTNIEKTICASIFSVFVFVCVLLQGNLSKYHNKEIFSVHTRLRGLCISEENIDALCPVFPFNLEKRKIYTATLYVQTLQLIVFAVSLWYLANHLINLLMQK